MIPLTPLQPWIGEKIGADGAFDRPRLETWQLQKLQQVMAYLRTRSRFYRERLAGLKEPDELADLAHFPFTTASDLRQNPAAFICVPQPEIERMVTLPTSGTIGAPKRLAFTAEDLELTVDFFQKGMSTFAEPGDRVLILLPGGRPASVGDLLAQGLARLGAEAVPHGPVENPMETLETICRQQTSVLVGAPVQVLSLVRCAGAFPVPVRRVLLSTDHVSQAVKQAIEAAWDCTVYNHYGMTEMGLGGGVECQACQGYHLREADLLFEVVDVENGTVLLDGEEGEVVFTTLTRRGMPLLRYRTGDMGRFLPEDCPCGTSLKRLERITTRVDGRCQLGPGAVLTLAELDEAIFPLAGVMDFEARLEPGSLQLTLQVTHIIESICQTVQRQVETLPAVCQQGKFDVRVKLQQEALPRAHPMAKRQMIVSG